VKLLLFALIVQLLAKMSPLFGKDLCE